MRGGEVVRTRPPDLVCCHGRHKIFQEWVKISTVLFLLYRSQGGEGLGQDVARKGRPQGRPTGDVWSWVCTLENGGIRILNVGQHRLEEYFFKKKELSALSNKKNAENLMRFRNPHTPVMLPQVSPPLSSNLDCGSVIAIPAFAT